MSADRQEARSAAQIQELAASAEAAERELLVACNALYIATDAAVADDVKQKARAVIEAHTAFNQALARRVTPESPAAYLLYRRHRFRWHFRCYDSVMDWDREKSSVTDEDGKTVGYIDMNDGRVHVWLYEDGDERP